MRSLDPDDPRRVGGFTLLARVAAGGMATVYFGRSATGRAAAVKVVHADLAADPDHRERFQREVTLTRLVGGVHAPALLDADPESPEPWLATEFVPSVSLRDLVRRHGPIPDDAAWPLVAGLAEALDAFHAAGVVHLDVKPANVLLTHDGLRVVDFGIASAGAVSLDGVPVGSPAFAAPEQVAGGAVGPAADVYALGATITWACAAEPALRELLRRCLDPDPAGRPSPRDLLDAAARDDRPLPPGAARLIAHSVAEAENPPVAAPVSRRRVLLFGAAAAAVAGVLWWSRPRETARTEASPTTTTTTTTTTSAKPTTRTLEVYIFGRTTVTTLTVTVNGVAETVANPVLPYRRTYQIPLPVETVPWSVDGYYTTGEVNVVVSVPGLPDETGGGSTNTEGEPFHYDGKV